MSIVVVIESGFVSVEAVKVAAALARLRGRRLVLLSLPGRSDGPAGEVEEALSGLLLELVSSGLEVERVLASGDPEEGLRECVSTRQAGLVVLAPRADGDPIHALGRALIRSLPVPVMRLRDPGSLLSWLRGEGSMKVLAPLDFSPASEAVIAWVRGLPELGHAELTVGHVAWVPEQRRRLGLDLPADPAAEEEEIRGVLTRELQELVGALPFEQPPAFEVRLGLGRTVDAIQFLAEEVGATLVVLGTRQRTGLSRLWHGSVAGGVLRDLPGNVVIVPIAAVEPPAERPLPRYASVLAATDFSDCGDEAVRHAYALLPKGGRVHLVHVIEPGAERLEPEALASLKALEPAQARAAGIQTSPEVLRARRVAVGLCSLAERRGADVIVVGSHGRGGLDRALFGSVAEEVFRLSRLPVLLVKPVADQGR